MSKINQTSETKLNFSVTKNGKPLDESLYSWNEETKTFLTSEYGLVLDFRNIPNCTFDTGYNCTFKTGGGCVIIRRDEFQIIQPENNEIIKLCPYNIEGYISKKENEDEFYMNMSDGTRQKHIIADNILSKIISKKKNKNLIIYKVINHNENNESFIIFDGENYSHGKTIKEAKESLIYKISSRDTSKYQNLKLNDEITLKEAIKMYRVITGACEAGTKYFCENNKLPEKMTIQKAIELTQGQYNHNKFEEFFKEN